MIERNSSLLQIMLYVTNHLGIVDPGDLVYCDAIKGVDPVILQLLQVLLDNDIVSKESDVSYAPYSDMFHYLFWSIRDGLPEFNE